MLSMAWGIAVLRILDLHVPPALAARWPAARFANSLVVLARKSPTKNLQDATPAAER